MPRIARLFMHATALLAIAATALACARTDGPPPAAIATGVVDFDAAPADAGDAASDSGPVADVAPVVSRFVAAPSGTCIQDADWKTVGFVYDGDTFRLNDGAETKIRMLGINTPEMTGAGAPECGAKAAKVKLEGLLAKGTPVCLVADDNADDVDKYARLLRYVYVKLPGDDGQLQVWQINANLVRAGLARVYYPFASGLQFEKTLILQQNAAKSEHLGGWQDCGW